MKNFEIAFRDETGVKKCRIESEMKKRMEFNKVTFAAEGNTIKSREDEAEESFSLR